METKYKLMIFDFWLDLGSRSPKPENPQTKKTKSPKPKKHNSPPHHTPNLKDIFEKTGCVCLQTDCYLMPLLYQC
jgi:hypothetical protein